MRAASTGGGRTARGSRPLGWYLAIALVVALGLAGIVTSRAERRSELAAGNNLIPPVANKDHWHAAYGVFLCDAFAGPITDERDPKGIHTHGDGIIHIHPFLRSVSGPKATLDVFADAVKMTINDKELRLPGGKFYKEGDTKCDGKPGIVQVLVDDKVVTENVAGIQLKERQLLTIAFAPKGAKLQPPPSAPNLESLSDLGGRPSGSPEVSTPSTVPGGGGAPGATTESTGPPTTAEGSSTTATP